MALESPSHFFIQNNKISFIQLNLLSYKDSFSAFFLLPCGNQSSVGDGETQRVGEKAANRPSDFPLVLLDFADVSP